MTIFNLSPPNQLDPLIGFVDYDLAKHFFYVGDEDEHPVASVIRAVYKQDLNFHGQKTNSIKLKDFPI